MAPTYTSSSCPSISGEALLKFEKIEVLEVWISGRKPALSTACYQATNFREFPLCEVRGLPGSVRSYFRSSMNAFFPLVYPLRSWA
jgi:hypothetical protein